MTLAKTNEEISKKDLKEKLSFYTGTRNYHEYNDFYLIDGVILLPSEY